MRLSPAARLTGLLVLCTSVTLLPQEAVDLSVVDRIKTEAFAHSEVMEHLRYLTDVHGPRLTGSPMYEEAAKWAVDRLTSYGLANVQIERWGPFGRAWSADEYSVELLSPHYARLSAMPLAWSAATSGPITGEPLAVPLDIDFMAGPKRLAASFDAFKREWTGKLRGRILLLTPTQPVPPREKALFTRLTDAQLAEMANAPRPAALARVTRLEDVEWPQKPEEVFEVFMSLPAPLIDQLIDRLDALTLERSRFLRDEGVAAVVIGDERAREGLLAAEAAGSFHARDPLAPPTFVVSAEHYDRMLRLIKDKRPVRLRTFRGFPSPRPGAAARCG